MTRLKIWTHWWRFGGTAWRSRLRARLLDADPVLWLACRERWQATSLWAVAVFLVAACAAIFAFEDDGMWWFVWNYLAGPVTLLLYLGTASQAARPFVEARRSGLLELLLSTPLTTRQIVQGQWRAMLRQFGLPLALCLATQWLGGVLAQQRMWDRMAATVPAAAAGVASTAPAAVPNTATTTGAVTVTTTRTRVFAGPGFAASALAGFSPPGTLLAAALACGLCLTVAGNLVALAWFGMWMGLTSKNVNLATLKTILFVQVIPWFGIAFASALTLPLLLLPNLIAGGQPVPSQMLFWFPILSMAVSTFLYLVKDAIFLLYARHQLKTELRRRSL
jgi:hypothetical protein